jgi:hypothetical protein
MRSGCAWPRRCSRSDFCDGLESEPEPFYDPRRLSTVSQGLRGEVR